MQIGFYASLWHYWDHLSPIKDKLTEFGVVCHDISRKDLKKKSSFDFPVITAGYGDLRKVYPYFKEIIYIEHGSGLTYDVNHPAYAGAKTYRDKVILRLLPNKFAYAKEIQSNPSLRCRIVGMPRLDKWHNFPFQKNEKLTICFSTHWDCGICSETRSCFNFYKKELRDIPSEFKYLGHSHPRSQSKIKPFFANRGIEFVESFEDVIERADIYAIDNSSTLFEFAAVKGPVIVMNCRHYKKKHKHNPRFFSHSDIGVNSEPGELNKAIYKAVEDSKEQRERREIGIAEIVPHLGSSSELAAREIISVLRT